PTIFSIGSPTGDNVVTLIEFFEQPRNICRIILQVGVHRDENVAPRIVDPGTHCRGLSVVASERNDSNAVIGLGYAPQSIKTSVAGAVVDIDDFKATAHLIKRSDQTRMKGPDVFLLVVHRQED